MVERFHGEVRPLFATSIVATISYYEAVGLVIDLTFIALVLLFTTSKQSLVQTILQQFLIADVMSVDIIEDDTPCRFILNIAHQIGYFFHAAGILGSALRLGEDLACIPHHEILLWMQLFLVFQRIRGSKEIARIELYLATLQWLEFAYIHLKSFHQGLLTILHHKANACRPHLTIFQYVCIIDEAY